jgi:hydrogenase nickel incorporation protein HypB
LTIALTQRSLGTPTAEVSMGRFHRHDDATGHEHPHSHEHADRGDHSGYATGAERIDVLERIFDENDRTAAANRADVDAAGATAVNVMSSPGAGKTTLLRETLRRLDGRLRIGVIEGDIETSLDADRLAGLGADIELINTGNGFGGECHLDAPMVRSALVRLPLGVLDLVIVENVGNLVCPAEFDVGEHARVMVFSVTEGEDKPLKYPVMFRSADVIIVNKVDLLPHLDFDLDLFARNLAAVNPTVERIDLSARTGAGVGAWCDWLLDQVRGPSRAGQESARRAPHGAA